MVLGRREFSAVLLIFGAVISVYMVLLAGPTSAQNGGGSTGGNTNGQQQDAVCTNPQLVETFTGTESQITPPFNITGNTFRLSYEAQLIRTEEFESGFLFIDTVDEEGLVVPFGNLDAFFPGEPSSDSTNVLEGPGTFTLRIESRNVEYTVTVEDCVESDGGTTGEPTNGGETTIKNGETIIDIPRDPELDMGGSPLPYSGGVPVYGMVAGFVLAGVGLLGIGLGRRRAAKVR